MVPDASDPPNASDSPAAGPASSDEGAPLEDREPTVDDLLDQLESLEESVDDPDEQHEVRRTIRMARRIPGNAVFGRVVSGFGTEDKAEAFVGSVIIGMPMLVEGGVFEIGDVFAARPLLFVLNLLFAIGLVVGIIYVAGFQDVRIRNPYFGLVPRRPVWVLGIAFATAAGLMTLWGRVTWADPWRDLCYVSVVFTAMGIGAALGDILPGE